MQTLIQVYVSQSPFLEEEPESVIYNGLDDNIWADRYQHGHAGAAKRHARRKLDYWKHEVEYRIIKVTDFGR